MAARTSLTYEWTITGAQALFDSTQKPNSQVQPLCSRSFGGGRWRLFFHANNGRPGFDGFVGVFLQCEPTSDEKRADIMGRWTRPGCYSFTVELQTFEGDGPLVTVSTREDVTFTHEKRQWGWPDYATRTDVFGAPLVTMHDAFILTCTIQAIPPDPEPALVNPSPAISSITLPIYSESAVVHGHNSLPPSLVDVLRAMVDDPTISDVQFVFPRSSSDGGEGGMEKDGRSSGGKVRFIWARKDILSLRSEYFAKLFSSDQIGPMNGADPMSPGRRGSPGDDHQVVALHDGADEEDAQTDVTGQVLNPLHHPHHPLHHASQQPGHPHNQLYQMHQQYPLSDEPDSYYTAPLPNKKIIYVNDIPYSTYKALISYLYTDTVVFAPLASEFDALTLEADQKPHEDIPGPLTRLDWLRIWKSENRGHTMPCSAKSMYAVATRFKLPTLRRLSLEFIRKNLKPKNLPFEYFDPFTAAHKELRDLALQGMVMNWTEVQTTPAMIEVWAKIVNGEMPYAKDLLPDLVKTLFQYQLAAVRDDVGRD